MRDRPNDEHRTLTEARRGRKLTTNEIVHHADEDKTNNADTNLKIEPRGEHTRTHNRQRGLSKLRAALRMVKEGKKVY